KIEKVVEPAVVIEDVQHLLVIAIISLRLEDENPAVELPRERRAAVAKAGADVSSEGVARSLLEPVGRFHPETAGQRLRVEPRGVVAPGGRHLDRLPLVRRPGLPVYRAPRDQ